MSNVAIVTGGSRGIGRNIAISLARRGVDSIITYHSNRTEADATVASIRALGRTAVGLQLDVGDSASFTAFVAGVTCALNKTWNAEHFDYLVNNAGTALHASFAATTEAQLDKVYNVNFKGVFFLTQALLPLIADRGRIVNISSGLARFTNPGRAGYGSMKAAIDMLTRYMALELGPRGIAVNAVAPGATATDFGEASVRDNDESRKRIASVTAMGRPGIPDDIGPMVALLLADENHWLTGQRIEVSGGMRL